MLSLWRKYNLFLIPPIFWGGMSIVLDFKGLFGQDAHEYYRYTQAFYHSLLNGQQPDDYFWGIGYPLVGALFSVITQNVLFSLQAISLICYTLIGILVYEGTRLIFPNAASVTPCLPSLRKIAILLLYFSAPYCIKMSISVMSDMLATLGIMLCFYGMTLFYYRQKNAHVYLAVFGATLAILTRYPPVLVLLPMLLLLGYWVLKAKKYVVFVFCTGIAAIGLGLHVWIKGAQILEFTHHGFLYDWTLLNSFRRVLHTPDGIQYCTFPNILYAVGQFWHPAYLIVGGILIVFVRKKDLNPVPIRIALLSILLYALFLTGIPFQNFRFLLLSFPLISLLLFPAFMRAVDFFSRYTKKGAFIALMLAIVGQNILAFKPIYPLLERSRWEKQVSADLQAYKGLTLYTFDIDVALVSYPVPLKVVNMWKEKIEHFEIGGLYFCEEKTLKSQWIGRNPLLNWQKVQKEYELTCLKTYKNGWKLYKITKKL